ncbi:hypothetical protein Tco_0984971, partial [Tanacetum coccineum]
MEANAVGTKFEATNKILRTIRGRIKETLREITKHQPTLKENAEHLAKCTIYVQKLPSFLSSTFSEYINIPPTALDTDYNVELADGKTRKFRRHYRDGLDVGTSGMSREIRSHLEHQDERYFDKGCQVFLVQMMKKEETEASEKRIEDVPVVRDFPE